MDSLPNEIIIDIIFYSTSYSDYVAWRTCSKRYNNLCKTEELSKYIDKKFVRIKVRISGPHLQFIKYIKGSDLKYVKQYHLKGNDNIWDPRERWNYCLLKECMFKGDKPHGKMTVYTDNHNHVFPTNKSQKHDLSYRWKKINLGDNYDSYLYEEERVVKTCEFREGKACGQYTYWVGGLKITLEVDGSKLLSYKDRFTTMDCRDDINIKYERKNKSVVIEHNVLTKFEDEFNVYNNGECGRCVPSTEDAMKWVEDWLKVEEHILLHVHDRKLYKQAIYSFPTMKLLEIYTIHDRDIDNFEM